MASIDERADGRYRARWREYSGGAQNSHLLALPKHFGDGVNQAWRADSDDARSGVSAARQVTPNE
jgi:hypothetical protein